MTVDVKRKDKNNFISIILNKVTLARNFHQRVALSITSKRILRHVIMKFYLRRRHDKLYLYTRIQDKFGSKSERHNFYKDFKVLVPQLEIEGKKGHYTGFILEITNENEALINFLKYIAMFARPQDFYKVLKKESCSYANRVDTSNIPIHLNIRYLTASKLCCGDVLICLQADIELRKSDEKYL